MLFSLEIIQLLVLEMSRYYHQYLDSLDSGWSPLPDRTLQDMYSFFTLLLQMGHDTKETLKAYWTRAKQFCTPFF
jgi:hypothetical protein